MQQRSRATALKVLKTGFVRPIVIDQSMDICEQFGIIARVESRWSTCSRADLLTTVGFIYYFLLKP
jgi:hypothetical protein